MIKISNKKIERTVVLEAGIDAVWAKWTTKEGLKSFFGVDNDINLRVGGKYEIYFSMDAPVGLRGSEGCKILNYQPKNALYFSWNSPPSMPEIRNSPYYTTVVLHFREIDEIHTELTMSHQNWPEDAKWDACYHYFDQAWDKVLNSLIKNL